MEIKFKKGDSVRRNQRDNEGSCWFPDCKKENKDPFKVYKVLSTTSGGDIELGVSGKFTWNHINFDLVKSNYKPKKPTHLVIWKEDSDPCEFFTNEDKATDFVKELIDKPNVKKDSILFIEIKSIKKVSFSKITRISYKEHKI